MKNRDKKPLYQVTYACKYNAIRALSIAAETREKAVEIGEGIIKEDITVELADEEFHAPAWVGGMAAAKLKESSLLAVRPQESRKQFDLTNMGLGEHL